MMSRTWSRVSNRYTSRTSSRYVAVESLDVGVLIGLSGLDVTQLDPVVTAPVDEHLGTELRTIVQAALLSAGLGKL